MPSRRHLLCVHPSCMQQHTCNAYAAHSHAAVLCSALHLWRVKPCACSSVREPCGPCKACAALRSAAHLATRRPPRASTTMGKACAALRSAAHLALLRPPRASTTLCKPCASPPCASTTTTLCKHHHRHRCHAERTACSATAAASAAVHVRTYVWQMRALQCLRALSPNNRKRCIARGPSHVA